MKKKITNQKIAPLLFFPLIENSFKHGLKNETLKFVDILLTVKETHLSFRIRNDKGISDHPEDKRYGGIGLENVKKRLTLIYGDEATFQINEDQSSFEVQLSIPFHD